MDDFGHMQGKLERWALDEESAAHPEDRGLGLRYLRRGVSGPFLARFEGGNQVVKLANESNGENQVPNFQEQQMQQAQKELEAGGPELKKLAQVGMAWV